MPGREFRARGERFFGRANGLRGFPEKWGWALSQNDRCFFGVYRELFPDLDKNVILREAPLSPLISPESVAPTEESLSEAERSLRHAIFPGSARKGVPREGRENPRAR
jgi:hypothetical protein